MVFQVKLGLFGVVGVVAWRIIPVSTPPRLTSGQIITNSAEVTLNGGLVRESPPNPLNSGLGIILICLVT